METLFPNNSQIIVSDRDSVFYLDSSITLKDLSKAISVARKALGKDYIITRKPSARGKIKISQVPR